MTGLKVLLGKGGLMLTLNKYAFIAILVMVAIDIVAPLFRKDDPPEKKYLDQILERDEKIEMWQEKFVHVVDVVRHKDSVIVSLYELSDSQSKEIHETLEFDFKKSSENVKARLVDEAITDLINGQ